MNQIDKVLSCIIAAMVNAPLDKDNINHMKLNLKDGVWCMVGEAGMEGNFVYVLPNHPRELVETVVLSAL